jgi:hypothetical protein
MELFKGRKLIIATKHHKERVIAPIMEKALDVECFVNNTFDTDRLGTFSGEVKRELDPLATARKKCLMAMEASNCDLGVASEGSFGPHPSLFFASADDEFLVFIDKKHDLEIIVRELSTETNFNGKSLTSEEELWEFAQLTKFPSHGLILKPSKDETTEIAKGINAKETLLSTFRYLQSKYGEVYVETDMRAMYNPSRMAVIALAAEKLAEKIQSVCPKCHTPGFGVTDAIAGLPCDLCSMPTATVKTLIYKCSNCNYKEERPPSHGKTTEDPTYCDYCNP